MGRPRKIDYVDVRRRYAKGETIAQLAAACDVSLNTIQRAVNPAYDARQRASSKRLGTTACVECGQPCARFRSHVGERRNPLCKKCDARRRTTTVRTSELACVRCKQWKPDRAFPCNRSLSYRRGRSKVCRPCSTEARQEYRERQKVPCRRCGAPCLPGREKGTRGKDTGLCKQCWTEVELPAVQKRAVAASARARRKAVA